MADVTKAKIGVITLDLVLGDITKQTVDAIVNAANSALAGGGGVDGAIHQAAGRELQKECLTLGRCPTGEARITKGYNLPAKHVIHAVGPVYQMSMSKGNPAELLASAYQYSRRLAQENELRTIAFPAISTGAYGYPMDKAAQVALNAVADYINENQPDFELVRFVLFDANALKVFSKVLATLIAERDEVKPA